MFLDVYTFINDGLRFFLIIFYRFDIFSRTHFSSFHQIIVRDLSGFFAFFREIRPQVDDLQT